MMFEVELILNISYLVLVKLEIQIVAMLCTIVGTALDLNVVYQSTIQRQTQAGRSTAIFQTYVLSNRGHSNRR